MGALNFRDGDVERYTAFADWHLGYWLGLGHPDPLQAFRVIEWIRNAGPLDEIDRDFYGEEIIR